MACYHLNAPVQWGAHVDLGQVAEADAAAAESNTEWLKAGATQEVSPDMIAGNPL